MGDERCCGVTPRTLFGGRGVVRLLADPLSGHNSRSWLIVNHLNVLRQFLSASSTFTHVCAPLDPLTHSVGVRCIHHGLQAAAQTDLGPVPNTHVPTFHQPGLQLNLSQHREANAG